MSEASANCRLAIGPANYAGQAYYWAESVTQFLGVPAFSFSHRTSVFPRSRPQGFQFPVHRTLPHHRSTTSLAKALGVRRLLKGTTHLALDGFLPLFDRIDRSHAGNDTRRLLGMGLQVALVAHGSDVRDPDAHMARYPFSYYRGAPDEWLENLRSHSLVNRRTVESFGGPTFVSTPDLLLDVPTATWLPLAIDLELWASSQPPLATSIPTVVHVPSRRNPPIKGTSYIDPVLQRLHDQGRINYVSPMSLPHASMRDLVRTADIVVDQILTGSYGAAAVEGMAAGRLVLGFVGQEVRDLMPESPPIVDAEPSRFAEVMDQVLAERDGFIERASRGPQFAQRWHSGLASARSLAAFLGQPSPSN